MKESVERSGRTLVGVHRVYFWCLARLGHCTPSVSAAVTIQTASRTSRTSRC